MEALRAVTDNINVFVRFLESVNCLFLQLQWLERNVLTQGQGPRMILVFVILGFCVYYTFVCAGGNNDTCQKNVIQVGVAAIILLVVIYLIYKKWQLSQSQRGETSDDEEQNKLIGVPIATATASAPPLQSFPMQNLPAGGPLTYTGIAPAAIRRF